MEFLLMLVGFMLDQGATTLRERLRSDDRSWAADVRTRLHELASLRLTAAEGEAVERWLARGDVVAALVEADPGSSEDVADRISAALAYELGLPPEEGLSERAAEISVATIVNLLEVVDPATSAALAVHDAVRTASSDLKAGQREMYVLLLEILERMGEPREKEPSADLVLDDTVAAADAVSAKFLSAVRRVQDAYAELERLRERSGNLGSTLRFHTARSTYNDALKALRATAREIELPVNRLDDEVASELYGYVCETIDALSEASTTAAVPGFPDEFPIVEQLSHRMSARVEELRRRAKYD